MKKLTDKEIYEVKKAVVVPFCMTECITGKDNGFYECDCRDCQVSSLRDIAKDYGFRTVLVGSETMIPSLKEFASKNHNVEASLGLICPEDMKRKTKAVGKENIEKIFARYNTYMFPRFCEGEGAKTIVHKTLRPTIEIDRFTQKLEELNNL